MRPRLAPFAAIILTALALVPAGAHLLALPNKIGLPQTEYFVVQGIYRGWALLGIILFASLAADVVLAIKLRHDRDAFAAALAGALLIAATLVIFFIWTYPANQATENWVIAPLNWQILRRHWEYAHAVNAVLTFLALCAVTTASIASRGTRA
jgi:hypothetical protein